MDKRAAWLVLIPLAVILMACGSSATTSVAPTPNAPTEVPAAAPATAGAPPAAAPATAVAAPAPAGNEANAELEKGRTPEGYHTLGSANAPVTFVMYSDFF